MYVCPFGGTKLYCLVTEKLTQYV